MKLIVLHGDGLVSKSLKISQIKKEFESLSIFEINGKEMPFDQAVISLSTPQLFSDKRLVVLGDFSPEEIEIARFPQDETLTILINFPKVLTQSSKLFKEALRQRAQIILLSEEEEKNIFPFLDSLANKDPRSLILLDKLLNDFGGQYILTMIFYMLRRLIQNPRKLPPFVLQKIEKQKRNFPLEKISSIYNQVIETDYKIKSGLLEEKIGITLLAEKILTI